MLAKFIRGLLWAAIQEMPADRWYAIDKDVRIGACMALQPERY